MGCGASAGPGTQQRRGEVNLAATKTEAPKAAVTDAPRAEATIDGDQDDAVEAPMSDHSEACLFRVLFDWSSCEFDVPMPSPLEAAGVPEETWYEFINCVNFELLEDFADKWRDPSLGDSVARGVCKRMVKTGTKDLAMSVVSLLVPLPASLVLDVVEKAVNTAANTIKIKKRRKEWDNVVAPAMAAWLTQVSTEKASSKGIQIVLGDARLSVAEHVDLKTRRKKLSAALAESKFDEKADEVLDDSKVQKLRELSNSFHETADNVESKVKGVAGGAKAKVDDKLEGTAAAEKIEEVSKTIIPALFFLPVVPPGGQTPAEGSPAEGTAPAAPADGTA